MSERSWKLARPPRILAWLLSRRYLAETGARLQIAGGDDHIALGNVSITH